MSLSSGLFSYAKWGIESGYPSSTADFESSEPSTSCTSYFMMTTNAAPSDNDEKYKSRAVGGGREIVSVVNGLYDCSIKIDGEVTEAGEGLWRLAWGGAPTGSGTITVPPANEISSFCTEVGYRTANASAPNFYRAKYHGCKCKSLTITWSSGDVPVKYSMDITAQRPKFSNSDVQTPAVETFPPYAGYETALRIPNVSAKAGVQEGSLTVTNELIPQRDTQSRFKFGEQEAKRDITFSFKVFFNSINEYEDFFGNTSAATTPVTSSTTTAESLGIVLTKGTKITTISLTNVYFEKIDATNVDTSGNPIVLDVAGFAQTLQNMTYVD